MRKLAIGILIFSAILSMAYSLDAKCERSFNIVKDFMREISIQTLALVEKEGYYPSWETTGTTHWKAEW